VAQEVYDVNMQWFLLCFRTGRSKLMIQNWKNGTRNHCCLKKQHLTIRIMVLASVLPDLPVQISVTRISWNEIHVPVVQQMPGHSGLGATQPHRAVGATQPPRKSSPQPPPSCRAADLASSPLRHRLLVWSWWPAHRPTSTRVRRR
jgi:hypothetical protein